MRPMSRDDAVESFVSFGLMAIVGGFLFHIGWSAFEWVAAIKW